jgi:hemerythrin-like domain-containing protein
MNNRSSSEALAAPGLRHRTELPGAWLYLAREFPRARWPELSPNSTAAHWLDMHEGFRFVQRHLSDLGTAWREQKIEFAPFRDRFVSGLGQYLQGMQVHHRVESTAYFPQFQAIEPRLSRGFDLMQTDHHEIDRILFELAEAGRALRAVDPGSHGARGTAENVIGIVEGSSMSIGRHLLDEEDLVIPLLKLRAALLGSS